MVMWVMMKIMTTDNDNDNKKTIYHDGNNKRQD